jgi:hypothetical protein
VEFPRVHCHLPTLTTPAFLPMLVRAISSHHEWPRRRDCATGSITAGQGHFLECSRLICGQRRFARSRAVAQQGQGRPAPAAGPAHSAVAADRARVSGSAGRRARGAARLPTVLETGGRIYGYAPSRQGDGRREKSTQRTVGSPVSPLLLSVGDQVL